MTLPPPPHGKKWCRVVDTNLASPKDYTPGGNAGARLRTSACARGQPGGRCGARDSTVNRPPPCVRAGVDPVYTIQPYSAVLLTAKDA